MIEEILRRLSYDPQTGILVWKTSKRGIAAGTPVRGKRPDGYIRVNIRGEMHYAHRIAFVLMTGKWPERHVDHIDGDPSNNRWANLREATPSQNLANSFRPNKTSSLKGVSRSRDRWRATISIDGKARHIGVFATKDEAHAAYVDVAKKIFGEFARTER